MSNTKEHEPLVSIRVINVIKRTETGRFVIVSSFLRGTSNPEITECSLILT